MANQTKQTAKKNQLFFDALADGKTVTLAAKLAGYTRCMVYEWKHDDLAFSGRWDDALKVALERMEAEADRRALQGVLKPVFQGGKKVGTVRVFSDTLLIFRMKALDPDKYRENSSVNLNLRTPHEDQLKELE
ncbi:MAG: terminase [Armatimonadota bacterium]